MYISSTECHKKKKYMNGKDLVVFLRLFFLFSIGFAISDVGVWASDKLGWGVFSWREWWLWEWVGGAEVSGCGGWGRWGKEEGAFSVGYWRYAIDYFILYVFRFICCCCHDVWCMMYDDDDDLFINTNINLLCFRIFLPWEIFFFSTQTKIHTTVPSFFFFSILYIKMERKLLIFFPHCSFQNYYDSFHPWYYYYLLHS